MNTTNSDPILALLHTDYIELDKLLKRENLAASGGEARYLIGEGLVRVNGAKELRKRRKLYAGDMVEYGGVRVRVIGPEEPGS